MGRFLNARAAAGESGPGGSPESRPATDVMAPAGPATEPVVSPPAIATPVSISPAVTIGLYALCVYFVSVYATDFSYRFLGAKSYVSLVSGIVLILCFLLSGRALVALQTTVGKLWLALGVWMCFSVLFSRWRGGSFELMQSHLPKLHMVLFYMAAFAPSLKQCRTLIRGLILGGFVLLAECVFLGMPESSGRFVLPSSILLTNPNDLAMELLLSAGFFLYLFRQPSRIGRVAGFLGMAGAAYFLLKTASRGAVLSSIVLLVLWVTVSQKRALLVVLALPAILVMAVSMPRGTLHRLSLIFTDPSSYVATTDEEEWAIGSQMERTHLLELSLKYAVSNPLFGIGPGRFADAIWEDGKKEGRHEASIGTHNTYTQIAAECGIPALLLFVAAVVVTIRSSFRLCRATMKDPSKVVTSGLAFTCFVLSSAYAVDIFFHHMAYSSHMATVLGLWVSLELATRKGDPAATPLMEQTYAV